jgi:hypothetical protein
LKFRGVDLRETNLTDLGLADLATNPKLCWLHLDKTRVTDAGIDNLKRRMQHPYLTVTS